MRLDRTRERARVLWNGAAALGRAVRHDRDPARLLGQVLDVGRREGLRGVKARLLHITFPPPPPPPPPLSYGEWLVAFDHLRPTCVAAARRHLATLAPLPEVLILAAVTHADVAALPATVASWRLSIHAGWRAAIVAAPDCTEADRDALRRLAADAEGVEIVAGADAIRAARRNTAFTLLCLGGGVRLDALSLYMLLEAATRTGAGVVYPDHDRVGAEGERFAPAFKPQYSPAYLARFNYVGDGVLVARKVALPDAMLAALAGGDGAAFDASLSALLAGQLVEHLPVPVLHLAGPARARTAARPDREEGAAADDAPTVSIVIPTRDGVAHLRACLDSIAERTRYDRARIEIVVIDNGSRDAATLRYLDAVVRERGVRVIRHPHPFNFAEINNVGARETGGEILVFLNDDTIASDPSWLATLVHHARQPDVGVVGARLLFPDGRIQHGGCVAGVAHGTVQHIAYNVPLAEAPADHTREMSVVTGACIAIRRAAFERVGGFDPILRITWNDVKLCLDCLAAGLRNVYVADPLMVHDESRTREQDKTAAHMLRYFREADYTRRLFRGVFHDDPSYSPNLSAETVGLLAEPPRVRRPWARPAGEPARILVLSAVYKVGFGVPLVIQQQVAALRAHGHDVLIGGPLGENEFAFPGCERVAVGSARDAAVLAFRRDVSLVISHTPPFFSVPLFIGGHTPVLAYDYGEPPGDLLPEPARSYLADVAVQKRAAAPLATRLATISQAVKDETLNKDATVLGLANSHLPAWSADSVADRARTRDEQGWRDRFVVLTVCRFGVNERGYKGLDRIASILAEFPFLYPEQARDVVWVVAGAGSDDDVREVERLGFTVFPNVSDDRLADLYRAADAYMGFSRWEGYNLGVSQALAMGLPTIASDIPAHREFPITTTDSILAVSRWLSAEVARRHADGPERRATVYAWSDSTARFAAVVDEMLSAAAPAASRAGASRPTGPVAQPESAEAHA